MRSLIALFYPFLLSSVYAARTDRQITGPFPPSYEIRIVSHNTTIPATNITLSTIEIVTILYAFDLHDPSNSTSIDHETMQAELAFWQQRHANQKIIEFMEDHFPLDIEDLVECEGWEVVAEMGVSLGVLEAKRFARWYERIVGFLNRHIERGEDRTLTNALVEFKEGFGSVVDAWKKFVDENREEAEGQGNDEDESYRQLWESRVQEYLEIYALQ